MKKLNLLLILICSFGLIGCTFIDGFKGNATKDGYIYISRGAKFDQVLDSLRPFLKDEKLFKQYAEEADYPTTIKSGKYKISSSDSNRDIIDRLQGGEQEEVKLRIKNEPTIYHLAGSVSKQIDMDSIEVLTAIRDFVKEKNDTTLNDETVKQYFIPETYFVYWGLTPEKFVDKMVAQHDKVWNAERLAKAKALNMSPLEVTTLASIVQLESSDNMDEQQKVARAYMNRLAKDMRLEADPTSIYAYKMENGWDQKVQRVYKKWTWSSNAYNTYRNKGLPPAPICLPNLGAIDAVLSPANHDFIFFVADPKKPGYHIYTNDYQEHLKNAENYRNWLKENNIK
ncbi:endolytic transglycosylase MltG [Empedobacter brevis]|uniref:endolytic transglycosylase MltG n=1 Tax=Empedobacter brevis TaxID=247 RepID=UPI00123DFC92|nr:endolytic transglycosylase MltG [Empedobacter brevis]QES91660.1 endolytic transglycosylase MltG [Empedobacter brevis]